MIDLIITRAAKEALARHKRVATSNLGWNNKQRDGSYLIELDEDTYERLRARQLVGESLSDTIIRIASTLS